MSTKSDAATAGIGAGSALAMILSFQLNHSILWAMLHGVCSWIFTACARGSISATVLIRAITNSPCCGRPEEPCTLATSVMNQPPT